MPRPKRKWIDGKRQCARCKEWMTPDHFWGQRSYCKVCEGEVKKKRRQEVRELKANASSDYKQLRRLRKTDVVAYVVYNSDVPEFIADSFEDIEKRYGWDIETIRKLCQSGYHLRYDNTSRRNRKKSYLIQRVILNEDDDV